MKMSIVTSVA